MPITSPSQWPANGTILQQPAYSIISGLPSFTTSTKLDLDVVKIIFLLSMSIYLQYTLMSRNTPYPEFGYFIKKQTFLSFSHYFMFDRIICVLIRIKVRGHLVMSIIQFMSLISVPFWTFNISIFTDYYLLFCDYPTIYAANFIPSRTL